MHVALCRHIKSDGHQCKAVALKTSVFCYFHSRLNEGHRLCRSRMVGGKGLMERGHIIALPALEDRLAVQLALSEVINALACNFIDIKRAQALFYGLQLASSNSRGMDAIFNPTEVVRTCDRAPDILDSVSVDIAPAGRTCEIPDPEPILESVEYFVPPPPPPVEVIIREDPRYPFAKPEEEPAPVPASEAQAPPATIP